MSHEQKEATSCRSPCYSDGMSNALERVARALCKLDGHPAGATMDGKPLWQDYLPEARAALMALREPDATMIDAACHKAAENGKVGFADIHRAVIDAALLER